MSESITWERIDEHFENILSSKKTSEIPEFHKKYCNIWTKETENFSKEVRVNYKLIELIVESQLPNEKIRENLERRSYILDVDNSFEKAMSMHTFFVTLEDEWDRKIKKVKKSELNPKNWPKVDDEVIVDIPDEVVIQKEIQAMKEKKNQHIKKAKKKGFEMIGYGTAAIMGASASIMFPPVMITIGILGLFQVSYCGYTVAKELYKSYDANKKLNKMMKLRSSFFDKPASEIIKSTRLEPEPATRNYPGEKEMTVLSLGEKGKPNYSVRQNITEKSNEDHMKRVQAQSEFEKIIEGMDLFHEMILVFHKTWKEASKRIGLAKDDLINNIGMLKEATETLKVISVDH
ncbi:6221_t:CDS:2 [Acaulospora morrowiae]|uniref:6221_t:CDS:1 n=1 Tax=Acaulospora morrowiae TaxID=94023 RepID=A0A9N9B5P9_9GLOM|nr:6221_t:CDS:2 [Acaulospora morrowiae]